jgi:hypothetical protein
MNSGYIFTELMRHLSYEKHGGGPLPQREHGSEVAADTAATKHPPRYAG